MNLKSINLDIAFLINYLKTSFGTKNVKPVRAIDTGIIHVICGIPVHIYYYTSKNSLVYTPAGIHTSYSKSFEGPQHPMCKLKGYDDYIFNEGGIKWKGNQIIFSTENWENNNPEYYSDNMLLGVIMACLYSLLQRLRYYIHLIEDLDRIIDYGHNMAPVYTYNTIISVLKLIDSSEFKRCVEKFMNNFKPFNLDELMILFEEIKFFSSDLLPKRKKYILDFYYDLKIEERIPSIPEQVLKPKRLF